MVLWVKLAYNSCFSIITVLLLLLLLENTTCIEFSNSTDLGICWIYQFSAASNISSLNLPCVCGTCIKFLMLVLVWLCRCSVWPSSLFLSELILSHPELFSNKSCFEVSYMFKSLLNLGAILMLSYHKWPFMWQFCDHLHLSERLRDIFVPLQCLKVLCAVYKFLSFHFLL